MIFSAIVFQSIYSDGYSDNYNPSGIANTICHAPYCIEFGNDIWASQFFQKSEFQSEYANNKIIVILYFPTVTFHSLSDDGILI